MSVMQRSLLLSTRLASGRSLIRSLSTGLTRTIPMNNLLKTDLLLRPVLITKFSSAVDVKQRIEQLVKSKDIVVFMKGNAQQPMCGFSKAVVDILNMHGAKFESYNVLADEDLRSGIKEYSNWPTIPQVFFKGEFIGGCDILLEMHRSGELVDELKKIGIKSKLDEE